ncbi:oxidoreductase [Kitasatospora sp. NBC_01287]|uniref:oxidoreductase n=1 Tax=Kitasatospora sp. NBC_01287 TaxID=2903573 RepID=UPI0022520C28|nr:oxidoreductase [Kitasatospora sp. NBC_01287]MCX4749654.1 oxidoreductase [Kitasatospora sp. NBC_01287]
MGTIRSTRASARPRRAPGGAGGPGGAGEAPARWSPVEQRLWEDFRRGEVCDLSAGNPAADDPAGPAAWGPERTVRAEALSLLLLAGPAAVPGTVRGLKLTGALITGRLDLAGGRITDFVELRACRFDTGVLLSEAQVGTLRLDGCWLPRLDASRLTTAGDLVLARCTVPFGVRLTDAQIGTDLIVNYLVAGCDQYKHAFSADGLTVSQDFEADRLTTYGDLSLRTAKVGGRLSLRGAELHARPGQGNCLNAARVNVGSTFYLSGWSPAPLLRPHPSAHPPALRGVTYSLPSRDPGPFYRTPQSGETASHDPQSYDPQSHDRRLPEQRAGEEAAGPLGEAADPLGGDPSSMYGQGFGEAAPLGSRTMPFRAYGGVRLEDARFEAACLIANAEFHLAPDQELSLRRIQTPELRFTCPTPPTGTVALSRARIGNLVDTPGAWPANHRVRLTGFAYDYLRPAEGTPFTIEQRIAWLDHALDTYHPEPYEQLAAALRRDGLDEDAREVQYAKQRRRRQTLPLPGRIWCRFQDVTVGYGYRPGRAALWLVAAWALGTLWFTGHQPPPEKLDEHPHWNAALYSASLVLPIVNLGQDGWAPTGVGQWLSAGLVMTGWLLATTAVTGATRILQRG